MAYLNISHFTPYFFSVDKLGNEKRKKGGEEKWVQSIFITYLRVPQCECQYWHKISRVLRFPITLPVYLLDLSTVVFSP